MAAEEVSSDPIVLGDLMASILSFKSVEASEQAQEINEMALSSHFQQANKFLEAVLQNFDSGQKEKHLTPLFTSFNKIKI